MTNQNCVVLFIIDGMRPDGMVQAHTPTMDTLRHAGAQTLTGRTVMPSMTLPCHTSLFHSVSPSRHGITTNTWTPQVRPVPGLFDILHQSSLVTAFFYNWEELRDLSRPGSLNTSIFIKDTTGDGAADTQVAHAAANWLAKNPFDFACVYLGSTDIAGHAYGWMSDPYLAAISHADRCIANVLDAIPQERTILITSDHGGHDQTHGTDSAEDMTIPLIVNGPTIPPSTKPIHPYHITDLAPTIAKHLHANRPAEWRGTPLPLNP